MVKNVLRSLVSPILGMWHRRRSQYVNIGKVALCCIAKMENEYIRFFVEYYKNLHFDKIFIYDNNDPAGERFDEVINDYIESRLVEIVDYRGRTVVQLAAYQDCYDRHGREYDWIAFFDCDEFLTFADGTDDIHLFLRQDKYLPFQVMHINWMVFGDSGQLDNDGRDITERLTTAIAFDTKSWAGDYRENCFVKSLVRGGLSKVVWNVDPHTPRSIYYKCCNAEGENVKLNSPIQEDHYQTAYLRHYSTKTVGEWVCNKMQRGFPDQSEESWQRLLSLDMFFRYNKRTAEKVAYAEMMMTTMKDKQ